MVPGTGRLRPPQGSPRARSNTRCGILHIPAPVVALCWCLPGVSSPEHGAKSQGTFMLNLKKKKKGEERKKAPARTHPFPVRAWLCVPALQIRCWEGARCKANQSKAQQILCSPASKPGKKKKRERERVYFHIRRSDHKEALNSYWAKGPQQEPQQG